MNNTRSCFNVNPYPRIMLFLLLVYSGWMNIESALAASSRLIVPEVGVYSGAYVDFGETEDTVTREAILHFEALIGKRLAIVAFSSYWGERSFPTAQMNTVAALGAIPLIFWSPWARPYHQDEKNSLNLHAILAGKFDTYIDHWADAAKVHSGRPILVAWGLEMNGQWFPWSGVFHGAGKRLSKSNTAGYLGPEIYKRAYRYVVDRVRARGANEITWVFHTNNYSVPDASWNRMAAYYPGSNYVDWLGMSAYGKQFTFQDWTTPANDIEQPYQELIALDPAKPVILAEWGVGEFPQSGSKALYIRDALQRITHLSRIKAAVFWHERWENQNGSFSNLYVNSSPRALEEYRRGIADPLWLDRPQ